MHIPLPHLPETEILFLSKNNYDDLCAVYDKLLLLAQLTGNATINGESETMLIIRRNLLGQLFSDLCFQISDVLDEVAKGVKHEDKVQAH
ncbi:hypothetical protein [Dyella sp. 2HG41-7]|uniref:XAC0095 family protein n=1 Tax=Dyella sp. 2HG41-7 TaxID=2883239 RepID=UPI001F1C51DB|nr:hypothetical protein [Dyella sp. 2HG41-7]